MPNEYYDDLKQRFFSTASAEKFVQGIEYLVSTEDFLVPKNFYYVAYKLHNEFISKFFTLELSNDVELLSRFAIAYASLLKLFVKIPNQDKNADVFKSTVIDLLNCIADLDQSKQLALELSSKLVKLDLPAEFCLTVVARANLNGRLGSQQQFMEILWDLYGNHAIWDNPETPRYMIGMAPNTPPTIAHLLHAGASTYCSQHANAANLVFLFYMQSCWFAAGNISGCNLIDHCLPFAVGALSLNKEERCPEWRWVLTSLAKYPKDSMEQKWRSKILAELYKQYWNRPVLLNELGISKQNSSWMSFLQPFACCWDEDYEEPISRRSSISMHYS